MFVINNHSLGKVTHIL